VLNEYQIQHYDILGAEMAPTKKTKKTADSINSRLALVMKSGKGKKRSASKCARGLLNFH
jgi:hypothetical protein